MKDNNYNNSCCQKCFSNPCVCSSSCYNSYNCYTDIPDIQTSLEAILDSEANISECASRLFNSLFPCEQDSTEELQKKINLFNTLLLSYSNRSSSLAKLLTSINSLDDTYVPNPHVDIFNDNSSTNSELSCNTSKRDFDRLGINSNPLTNHSESNIIHPQHICNGIYFLEKIKIYFSKYTSSKIFEIYLDSKTLKIIYIPAKNPCNITKTYII